MTRTNDDLSYNNYDPVEERSLSRNASGHPDPTAYRAMKNIEAGESDEWERHHKLIGCLLRICELSGFSLEERIVVRDNRTGKVWR